MSVSLSSSCRFLAAILSKMQFQAIAGAEGQKYLKSRVGKKELSARVFHYSSGNWSPSF